VKKHLCPADGQTETLSIENCVTGRSPANLCCFDCASHPTCSEHCARIVPGNESCGIELPQ